MELSGRRFLLVGCLAFSVQGVATFALQQQAAAGSQWKPGARADRAGEPRSIGARFGKLVRLEAGAPRPGSSPSGEGPDKPRNSEEVFRIGTKDRSYTEFARPGGRVGAVVYRVGQSSPGKDWPAYQPGTFDYVVGKNTREQDWLDQRSAATEQSAPPAFEVDFNLSGAPRGKFTLHLDAIFRYRRPAAPRLLVEINGHKASYQLNPRSAPELWWPTGSDELQFVGYQSLDIPLAPSNFKQGGNALRLRCVDGYGIYYDDLALTHEPGARAPAVAEAAVEPTIFYKRRGNELVELLAARVRSSSPIGPTTLRLVAGSHEVRKEITQSDFGDIATSFEVPAIENAVPVTLYISGRKAPVYQGTLRPRRRWRVYAMPMEQADFGYNEIPARTLEWENRYNDRILDIMHEFPSYSFTLDAAANLESYLATRDEARAKQVLDYLRSGKFGINAFYEHFFTGLATPEELFRLLEYALRAGRQYGFPVDSAGQTDEPSVTWAFPEVLAESGIAYFADGSDPTRGPINPIGLLNLRSPFYWEGPNGAKVLTWSAVGYIAVEDMTWGGWDPEAVQAQQYRPSLFGLEHSLPLFLSQYDRDDYPFDAVFLYGLHNDEIPIRHYGSADVIELWNKEYAYPQVIPATERDYFRYVTEHFGERIQTYRGDGGAYWEDEAGADARIAALNRVSQMQVQAAEKLESLVGWMQPFLRFDESSFQAAWNNIMLTDCYVWSDSNSMRRPSSYRVRVGEDVHRGWAEAAYRQTRDLLTMAIDKLGELIQTDRTGALVFNAESWTRGGFFDFELELDEALQDPATGQTIPCGSVRSLGSYQEVRCWAAGVPPMGYKFYPAVKGKVPAGEPVLPAEAGAAFESKHYRLQLDPQTGSVAHLIDKTTGQDVVNASSGYGLNEYLYVTGGDPSEYYQGLEHGENTDNRLLASDPTLPIPELAVHRPSLVEAPRAERFPWGAVVTTRARAPNTPGIVSRITLNDLEKTVSFENEVEKTATLKKEGVYFAFPFAAQTPRVEYQGATAWVNPETDLLPGANRQWFATQGGVWVQGAMQSIAWASQDGPLITLEDINRGLWPESIKIRSGWVFSYAMNNYWFTDTPAQQGGHFTFRYALTSGSNVTRSEATRLAMEMRSPLVAIRHEHKEWKQALPENGSSFLRASPEGVGVLTVRPLAGNHTYLMRVHNSTDHELVAEFEFPLVNLEEAYLGSPLGERRASLEWGERRVKLPMKRYDVKTVVIKTR